jgi:hypothetical protein
LLALSTTMPPRSVLFGLLLLSVAPPFVSRAFGSYVGASTMYTRLERYHLQLSVQTPTGAEPVSLRSLAPHMSRDARNTLLPAEGHAVGADQVAIVAGGLGDLAHLLCSTHPQAISARAQLERSGLFDPQVTFQVADRPCGSDR